MCVVKSPKVDPASTKPKDPTIIRNQYFDGTGPQIKSLRKGRSSLRIERAGSGAPVGAPPATALPSPLPIMPMVPVPVPGTGGVGGGGFRDFGSPMVNWR